ncbi:DUF2690 domain-containing protein [Streptomyces sp. HPF1205]|uniref:DUF2690 domain-containing protein n=1 Tax=Streptomyces sp. HPF1205 TaxID=2873262 RepID=UPI001CEC52A5|nr:DUF2690 domain-containing protein [Streptomyces sp. HPF1205]
MGRGMRPLSPDDGPVERFACELRALRALAGDQPFWKMARRCSVAKSALAAAAAGRHLPSKNVTREFVRACKGDWAYWEERWEQAAAEAEACRRAPGTALVRRQPGVVDILDSRPPATIVTGRARTPPDSDWDSDRDSDPPPEPKRARFPRWWKPIAVTVLVAAAAGGGYAWQAGRSHGAGSAGPAALPVSDGTDPQAVGCNRDVTNLATAPLRLQAPLTLRGQHLSRGTLVGRVTLRYSPRCAGAWARFDPAPVIDTDLKDSTAGAVTVTALRPADTTEQTWKMGHIDNAFSGLLLTGLGCVVAEARIDITNENMTAQGQTPCLPALAGKASP